MKWFKMYSEARFDNKLRVLNDTEFRAWFNLLCMAAEQKTRGYIEGRSFRLIAIEVCTGDCDVLRGLMGKLAGMKMIEVSGGEADDDECEITFIKFSERQTDKPSSSTEAVKERVQRHRNRNVTPCNALVTPCNADVTPFSGKNDQCNAHVTPKNALVTPLDKNRLDKSRLEESANTVNLGLLSIGAADEASGQVLKSVESDSTKCKPPRFSEKHGEQLYMAYPRKTNRREGVGAAVRAVTRIASGKDRPEWFIGEWPPLNPMEWLTSRVQAYAQSLKGQPPSSAENDYRPHPATWFNQGGYCDDEAEWNREVNQNGKSNTGHTSATAALAARRAAEASNRDG